MNKKDERLMIGKKNTQYLIPNRREGSEKKEFSSSLFANSDFIEIIFFGQK